MANPNFNPSFSTNNIWRDLDDTRCLTDDLDTIESDISDLETGKANVNHTHNYAGSSSDGGAANSADKLNTNAGSTTQAVYFENGVPVATTYTLGKSVPSDAVFTDTTYSTATTSAAGLMSASDKTKLDGIATGANNYTLPTASSTLGGVKTTSTVTSNSGYTACPIISGVPYYKDTNTIYTSLKNPYALTLQFNGTTNKTYDGSSAQTFNVTPAAIGEADYVIAQGSNSNGYYRKWNSGKMEEWVKVTTTNQAINTAYGSIYIGSYIWTFPVAFYSVDCVQCSCFRWGTSASWGSAVGATATYVELRGYDYYSRATGTSCSINAYAIGRWK